MRIVKWLKNACIWCLLASMLAASVPVSAEENTPVTYEEAERGVGTDTGYSAYLEAYTTAPQATGTITLTPDELTELTGGEQTVLENRPAVALREGGSAAFTFEVEEEGLYQLQLEYYALEGKGASLQTSWTLDGNSPFLEAQYVILNRMWKDAEAPGTVTDSLGNDLMPQQKEEFAFQQAYIRDTSGIYDAPYWFYLSKGTHTLGVEITRETLAIGALTFRSEPQVRPYAELEEEYQQKGYKPADVALQTFEAEITARKSDSVLYARTDKASPLTTPYSTMEIKLNTVGGASWSSQGQWIEWSLDVPADGLYCIALRARQDQLSGSFVSRRLLLDGSIPAAEFADIRVSYSGSWQNVEIPYAVYLTEGTHTLRMEVTVGAMSETIAQIDQSLSLLNLAYRKIVMITGNVPDAYRDYRLAETLPEVFEIFRTQAEALLECDQRLLTISGKRGSMNAILQTMALQLEEFAEKPEKIQTHLQSFRDNITALSSWLANIKSQPLEIDKIYLYPQGTALPPADAGFWGKLVHELKCFISSFVVDYNSVGDKSSHGETIEVWVQAGRDQANILKNLIVGSMELPSGAGVNLKLVSGQLQAATAAGRGPDVALQVAASDPVNYATRNACVDLTQFPDFEEVRARFRDSAFVPYTFEGGVYALPETQTFQMMFYREDIFDELGLEVPQTWDELFYVLGRLQKNNMTIGLQPPNSASGNFTALSSMAMLLYQRGGELYLDGSTRSGLSSKAAEEAFAMWTSMYTDYEVPLQYDALNRFRTGEMPLVIEDFSLYNLLNVGAPEIRGMWKFTAVPATPDENGDLNNSVAGTGIGCMLLKNSTKQQAAWEFMKWWTSADIQTQYGREIENQLGPSARYSSANIEAFNQMPWTLEEMTAINAQWENVHGIPEVAGGYFTARHLNNAFRRVLAGDKPRDAILEYAQKIDAEIAAKRKELRLD